MKRKDDVYFSRKFYVKAMILYEKSTYSKIHVIRK